LLLRKTGVAVGDGKKGGRVVFFLS
jgi:hypothetical protein